MSLSLYLFGDLPVVLRKGQRRFVQPTHASLTTGNGYKQE